MTTNATPAATDLALDETRASTASTTVEPSEYEAPIIVKRPLSATEEDFHTGGHEGRSDPPSSASLYPHVYDAAGPAGQAVRFVQRALDDSRAMLAAHGDADLLSVQSGLALVAASAAKAHELADFDDGFGAIVSFVRRAALSADAADLDLAALNALVQVLASLLDNPVLGYVGAAEMAELLAANSWNGESEAVDKLLSELLCDSGDPVAQIELFTSNAVGK